MKAETAVKSISRIVVMLHPGLLSTGSVLTLAMTDFDNSDKELDAWKRKLQNGGACLYDGPPTK